MSADAWDPALYARFEQERRQPFKDLVQLVDLGPGKRVVDLGCGTGALTRAVHQRFHAAFTLGIDSSDNMLAKAAELAGNGLVFERRDIAELPDDRQFDLVFSNAALHWVPDHAALFRRLTALLMPGGQLAVQLPDMERDIAHRVAAEIAARPRFCEALGGYVHHLEALGPEQYAELLFSLGYRQQHVQLQIYPHTLPSREEVVVWVRGTLLTAYQRRLSPALFQEFVDEYRDELLPRLSPTRPYFLGYRRILIWGRR